MKKESRADWASDRTLLALFIRQRRIGALTLLLLCVLLTVSFLLYRLPLGAVLYPCLLCLLLCALMTAADFRHVRRKHRQLEQMTRLTDAMISDLPALESPEDADYQAIIRTLQEEQTRLQTETSTRYADMMDYYTVWVHQIKTPIASMRLTLQNEDSPLSRKLASELFRIEQYVEMVLAFLRLDSSSTDYVIREHDLDTIIRGTVRKFAGEFIGRKLSLEYEPIRQTVVTDEKWLSFVLEQVLSNALKYTPSGGIRIYLEEPKTLCIADTGIGIAPEDLPRVFEKGYTGYNGRSDKKASGLGLYLCKSICTKLGHPISVSASLQSGTVIRIRLSQYQIERE